MAELASEPRLLSGARLATEQMRAIVWLRWRILANGFRRKGGAGELVARILLFPLFAILALLPTLGAGTLAWYCASAHQLDRLVWVLWGAVALTQLVNINLGQPGTTFDPVELIRFPMPLRRFVLVRLCFGLLTPGNVIVSLISLAVAVGLTVAHPSLCVPALLTMLVFALTNVLFTRMIFAWVDRWLSTRRAREVFTAFIFVFSLSIQYVNVRFNPGFQHNRNRYVVGLGQDPQQSLEPLQATLRRVHPFVAWLPPELSTRALVAASKARTLPWSANTGGCALFSAAFLAVYSLRMRTEFHGENLSDTAIATVAAPIRAARRTTPLADTSPLPFSAEHSESRPRRSLLPPTLAPLLSKELLVLRRNMGLFYGLVAPAVMVFLFAGRMSSRSGSHWVLLGAVAYALLGISPMSYNSFGFEGTGAQFYFFAPIKLRDIFFAKNLFGVLLAVTEVLVVVLITSYVAGRPRLTDCVFAVLWATGTLLINTTLGNLRSVSAPKKVNPGRTMTKAQSAVSGYIAIGVLLGCVALGFGCELLTIYLRREWIGLTLMLLFAAAGIAIYAHGLAGIEAYALARRDILFEELGKKT